MEGGDFFLHGMNILGLVDTFFGIFAYFPVIVDFVDGGIGGDDFMEGVFVGGGRLYGILQNDL